MLMGNLKTSLERFQPVIDFLKRVQVLPVVRCDCGRKYTEKQWNKLPYVGHMDLYEDNDGRLELRNCTCRSTRGLDRPAKAGR